LLREERGAGFLLFLEGVEIWRVPVVMPPKPTEERMPLFSWPSRLVVGAMVHDRRRRSSIVANGPDEDEDEEDEEDEEEEASA